MNVDVARLRIEHYPAPMLRKAARPVEAIDATVRAVAARMRELMAEVDGAGLAAPQVRLSWRLFVTKALDDHPERVFINPALSELSPDMEDREEGCLSLPGVTLEIRRSTAVTVTALDLEGREVSFRDAGLLARIWQHEVDHLNGVLIIDKMTPMDRIATRKVLKELEATART